MYVCIKNKKKDVKKRKPYFSFVLKTFREDACLI